jgi:hypothetical protein
MRKGAASDNRRMRLLGRLWPGLHRREIDELAVIVGGMTRVSDESSSFFARTNFLKRNSGSTSTAAVY